jgi:hypothetical protein
VSEKPGRDGDSAWTSVCGSSRRWNIFFSFKINLKNQKIFLFFRIYKKYRQSAPMVGFSLLYISPQRSQMRVIKSEMEAGNCFNYLINYYLFYYWYLVIILYYFYL